MFSKDAPLEHTCPHCGGPTIWITRAGDHDVQGCPRCTQVGALAEEKAKWLSGDAEIGERKNEKSEP